MIVTFLSEAASDIYHGRESKQARKMPQTIWRAAERKMDLLNAAHVLGDLREPTSNHLETLKGKLKGKYSIRINDQYRLVFEFRDGNAYEVEIIDYH